MASQRIAVSSPHIRTETIEMAASRVVLSRVEGPEAAELFLHCQPRAARAGASEQAEAIYCAIADVLEAQGATLRAIVCETIFLRSVLAADVAPVRAARRRVLAAGDASDHRPATTEVEQPPLDEQAWLEVSVQAVLPTASRTRMEPIAARSACDCAGCDDAHGLRLELGHETRLYAGGLFGAGADAHEQTIAMFEVADDLVQRAGMEFGDVVRTWIHLRDIDRDYDALNRGRRAFFESRGVDPVPASTGIGGGPVPDGHEVCLAVYAARAPVPRVRTVMTTPTLNEAPQYGADFSRGMKVVESNKVALYVSGTASIDEAGRTAHVGDFDAQADRMLVNVAALLERQGAGFADLVSAVTYLKHPADSERLRAVLREAGFEGFPHALVEAPICRPDLLCETEALAVMPRT